jgi:hypothetical protein
MGSRRDSVVRPSSVGVRNGPTLGTRGRQLARLACVGVAAMALLGGCTRITLAPVCPGDLMVGETAALVGNPAQPGAIPTYQWTVSPSSAGTFSDATAVNTTFQALQEGEATITLTASDGLFQAVSSCTITISGFVGVAVSLEADPTLVYPEEEVTLTCSDVGVETVVDFSIFQSSGPDVELEVFEDGTATFVAPDEFGDLLFECRGANDQGLLSDVSLASVRIVPEPSDNDNANDDANDNSADNQNDNGDPNDNANENQNENDNSGENANDNEPLNENDNTDGNENSNGNG